jgi:outer membrane receptor protein involved in Fe transport
MLLIACFCSSLGHADAARTVHFDIPAGDAQKTLLQFLTQSNIEMLYSSDDVRGLNTHAIAGELTVPQALRQMLDGTGLNIAFENDFTFASIKPAKKDETGPDTPAALSGTLDSNFRELRGQPIIPLEALAAETKLEEVVVTGTLIHGVLDIMSPLQFVTRNDMNRTSYATVQDALRALTLTGGGGPSEDVNSSGNFTRGVAANLRGLGPGATLVLIDGQRQPISGSLGDFVDISNIPWSAVDRIEVLPDGTSALYGSDAVAGVVNIIMRKDVDGGETWARLGNATGGADEKLIAQLFGHSWENGSALFSYQYNERTGLAASARDYAASSDKTALGGTDHRSTNSSPGNILDPMTFQPAFGIPTDASGRSPSAADLLPGQINLQNRYATANLLPDRQMHSLYFNGSQRLSDRFELFGQARYSHREIEQQLYAADQVLLVPTTNPYAAAVNPFAGVPYVLVGYSFLDAFGPILAEGETETYTAVSGLKVRMADSWRLTLSGSYGAERMDASTRNLPDQEALNRALGASDETAFNPFGSNSAAVIDAVRSRQHDTARSSVTSGTLVADGNLLTLPTGYAKIAVGGEWREERFGNAVNGGMPFARDVRSAFTELSIPLVGQLEDPRAVPRLELSLAGRYERYSDFGAAWNPKVGLRWAPNETFKLRTSWGTSFKAPRLSDLYDSSHNTAVLTSFIDPSSETGSSVVLAFTGNNPHLKEETASTWTAGIDLAFDTLPMSTLSLTYYSINYTDRIVLPGFSTPADILLHEGQWASVITRNPSRAQIEAVCDSPYFHMSVDQCKAASVGAIIDFDWRNLAATRVQGLDLKLDRPLETSRGFFQFGLDGSYVLSFDQAVSDTSPLVNIADTVGNPLAFRLRGIADWYQRGPNRPGFGASLTVDHTGGYRDSELNASRSVSAYTSVDVRFRYRTPKGAGPFADTEINLNTVNLFNRAPPFVDREDGYDVMNNDPYGRVVSFTLQKKW